jgi:hypothetical protein
VFAFCLWLLGEYLYICFLLTGWDLLYDLLGNNELTVLLERICMFRIVAVRRWMLPLRR